MMEMAAECSAAAGGRPAVCVCVTHREAIWELQEVVMDAVGGSRSALVARCRAGHAIPPAIPTCQPSPYRC